MFRIYAIIILMDKMVYALIYDLIYCALAEDERSELFGEKIDEDSNVFVRSFAGEAFPQIWFELPLIKDARYDLHVLTSRRAVDSDIKLCDGIFYPELFRWFSKSSGTRRLAMSHDLSKGIYDRPAAQLLFAGRDTSAGCDFLAEAKNASAASAYKAFCERIPKEWFACYVGTFPQRNDMNLRVECIPDRSMQAIYSKDEGVLRRDLSQAGFEISDEMLRLVMFMALQNVRIEFQFNVDTYGCATPLLGVSLCFMPPTGEYSHLEFSDDNQNVISLMSELSSLGLCDNRWKLLPGCAFAKCLTAGDASVRFGGYTAFIKVRMTRDRPIDAKAYIVAKTTLSKSVEKSHII